MHSLKWISTMTILALLFAMLPATVAEDEVIIDLGKDFDDELGLELDKPGKAKITVKTDNGKKASAIITVKPAPKKVRLNVARVTLGVKKKLTLKATLTPSSAYTTLTWKSSKPAVASVSKKGVVTAKKPGTAVITVRTHNGKTAKVTIKVK